MDDKSEIVIDRMSLVINNSGENAKHASVILLAVEKAPALGEAIAHIFGLKPVQP